MELLSAADKDQIKEKVAEVETRTAGEVVVMVVGRSDDYLASRLIFAGCFSLSLALLLEWFHPELPALWLLLAQAPLVLLLTLLLRAPGMLRRIVPAAELTARTEQRAERAFLERGVFATRDRTGVLILLSELEHRAVILGDEGIHRSVTQEGWQAHVQHLVAAIRAGRAAVGICEVLDQLAGAFERGAPIRADDRNELPDAVVEQER